MSEIPKTKKTINAERVARYIHEHHLVIRKGESLQPALKKTYEWMLAQLGRESKDFKLTKTIIFHATAKDGWY